MVLMWSSLFYTTTDVLFQPASRRLANWAYYNWMVAYNLSLLLLFLAVDLVSAHRSNLIVYTLETNSEEKNCLEIVLKIILNFPTLGKCGKVSSLHMSQNQNWISRQFSRLFFSSELVSRIVNVSFKGCTNLTFHWIQAYQTHSTDHIYV